MINFQVTKKYYFKYSRIIHIFFFLNFYKISFYNFNLRKINSILITKI